ncbi:hypothetical protein HMI55_004564 [Coelomomyces lativittatus]|nr:hypothetical protein HMI55_004564 [Coelomomyces lativittatus]
MTRDRRPLLPFLQPFSDPFPGSGSPQPSPDLQPPLTSSSSSSSSSSSTFSPPAVTLSNSSVGFSARPSGRPIQGFVFTGPNVSLTPTISTLFSQRSPSPFTSDSRTTTTTNTRPFSPTFSTTTPNPRSPSPSPLGRLSPTYPPLSSFIPMSKVVPTFPLSKRKLPKAQFPIWVQWFDTYLTPWIERFSYFVDTFDPQWIPGLPMWMKGWDRMLHYGWKGAWFFLCTFFLVLPYYSMYVCAYFLIQIPRLRSHYQTLIQELKKAPSSFRRSESEVERGRKR